MRYQTLTDRLCSLPDSLNILFRTCADHRICEYTFLEKMTDEVKKKKIYETLLSYKIPCLIFCRNLPPEAMLLEMAEKANIPVFQTEKKTSEFTAEIIRWLNVELAPCISIHGVLVDVYGVGVLIMGESGIGKSEAALELSNVDTVLSVMM